MAPHTPQRSERPGEPVALLDSPREVENVILTDVRMPKLDGPGLYRELAERRPELLSRLIFVTGNTLGRATREFLARVAAPTMTKPFDVKELRTTVQEMLERNRRVS